MNYAEISRNGPVLEIVLNRPKANAINTDVSMELAEAFFMLRDDPSLRAAIITGAGDRFFSAGWDLKAGEAVDADHGPGGFAGLTEIFDLRKPVIAAVNGLAVGGGFELALACDLIIAADHAEFFFPEVSIGIIPDAGGVLRLPKVLPRAIALEMLYTGRRLSAERAHHFGLVNHVVKDTELMDEARKVANEIVRAAPLAISAVKEVLRHTEHVPVEEGYEIMRSGQLPHYRKMLQSQDVLEGQKSFAEKRDPVWSGK
ncbi:crotonobetainyl-CoA hydratase [Siminovitchia acidinfaciens]|uniref:Crotonobetainyl-CoA hydratase n=1 Tax=Siminovitchia acidinfaciens TaxID=2321395 RepID=A0A429Y037_9BACI|nr:enoyl-CoA hydratase-related protein [Siminovitchia acidinfaciens]RST74400.1 crotonobetainyl-CoA hydratase [Siminovitchia acidinfaciens]